MKFLVKVGLDKEARLPEVEVEAEDRWGALVEAVKLSGLEKRFTMSAFWRGSSIVKKDKPKMRFWRKEDAEEKAED